MSRNSQEGTRLEQVTHTEARALGGLLRRALFPNRESSGERITRLAEAVTRKVLGDIAENGTVSLFTNVASGQVRSEIFRVDYTSPKIPHLSVSVYRQHDWAESSLSRQLQLSLIEHLTFTSQSHRSHKYRSMSIERDKPYEDFSLRFAVGGTDDGQVLDYTGKRFIVPCRDKIGFMDDILETELDIAGIEKRFGASYVLGAVRDDSYHMMENGVDMFSGHWVRDVLTQLQPLSSGIPELQASEHSVEPR